jgi:hypothetical protein
MSALTALGLAGWVALTIVPVLARRTPLRWLTYQIDYKADARGTGLSRRHFRGRAGRLNTGNNLLFMVLACLLAGVLISGMLSRLVLSGIDVRLELPEHIFAERAVLAIAELHNTKQMMPSFSVSLVSEEKAERAKKKRRGQSPPPILDQPIYFPHIPHGQTVRQNVELTFPGAAFTARTRSDCARNFRSAFFKKRATSIPRSKRSCIPPSSPPRNSTKFCRS